MKKCVAGLMILALAPTLWAAGENMKTPARSMPLRLEESNTHELRLRVGESLLVAGEALTLADFTAARQETLGATEGWQQVTALSGGTRDCCAFYREIGIRPDRAEITWTVKYAPNQFGKEADINVTSASYDIRIPLQALEGAKYSAVAGPPLKPVQRSGTLSSTAGKIEGELQYITFTRPDGAVTFDLNAAGPHTLGRKEMLAEEDWSLLRDKEGFILRATLGRVAFGDTRRFKVVITPDDRPYDTVHTASKRGFSPMLTPSILLNCGGQPLKGYRRVDASAYTARRAAGWIAPKDMQLVSSDLTGIYQEHVRGSGQASLRVDAPDGIYLVNMLFGSPTEDSEAFDVAANGEVKLKALRTRAGAFSAKTLHTRVTDGRMTLTLNGPRWMLAALSLTPLVLDEEDYLFRRAWFIRQAEYDAWFAQLEPTPPLEPAVPPAPAADAMEWAWNGAMTTYEGALTSSRTAYDTVETARARMESIKAMGYKAVLINGLHFRFNHYNTERYPVMLRNTRLAVEEGRRAGLRVFDHWELNWVMYPGYPTLLNLVDQDPDCLQRSVNPLVVSTSFCLNSEVFTKFFIDRLIEHQRATGVDGHMIDEISWIRPQFCCCDTCRGLFEKETGVSLPYDTGTILEKLEDPTWRALTEWRGRKVADMHGRLHEAERAIRPDVVHLRYTSNFLSLPNQRGLELNAHMPWKCDYIGDEFHPDLMLQNWRVLFGRIKNRQGAVAAWGNLPTWVLPKFKHAPNRTLFIWGITRMNRANIWYRPGNPEYCQAMHTWPGQMDDRNARPLSDVAVLLSQQSRNLFNEVEYYHNEHAAWLQTLAEENIQYDVILDIGLKPETLSRYAVLILPNAAALSDAQAAAIKDFVAKGGRVVATYETGFCDEKGAPRAEPVLAEAMNLRFSGETQEKGRISCEEPLRAGMQRAEFETPARLRVPALRNAASSVVLAQGEAPAVIETRHGKGAWYYLSGNFLAQNAESRIVSTSNQTTLKGRAGAYDVHFNPDLNHLARNLITRAIGEDFRTRAVDMPRGVIYTAFAQKNGEDDRVLIHLLNCSGRAQLRHGDTLKLQKDEPAPPIPSDMRLCVVSERPFREAFASAPFNAERVPVTVQSLGNNRYEIVVPREALKVYALVHLVR